MCGDGTIQGDEECDDGEANSDNAPDACRTDCKRARCGDGTPDTDEACDDGNTASGDGCSDTCQVEPHCGDGVRNGDEACDGDDIPTSCTELGFVTGEVACTAGCTIDQSACRPAEDCSTPGDEDGDGLADCADPDCEGHFECPACGDGVLQRDEACEDEVPAGQSCADHGFNSGSLACVACQIDTTGCTDVELCDVPGDEDGNQLADCADPACDGHFECPSCGDGVLQRGEMCDGAVPAGLSCANYGYNNGALACMGCQIDSTGCFNTEICDQPGDEDGDGDENCDDSDCIGIPPCIPCGNGTIDPGESCDDGNTIAGDGCSDACQIEGTLLLPVVGLVVQFSGSLEHPDPQHAYRPNTFCSLNSFGPQYYDLHYVTNPGPGLLHVQLDATWVGSDLALSIGDAPYDPANPVDGCIDFDDDDDGNDVATIRNVLIAPGQTLAVVPTTYFVNNSISSYTVSVTTMGVCGDGVVNFPETCDDGNLTDGDGCNSVCGIPPVVRDVEPNETTSAATPLASGSIGLATLDAAALWFPADPADVWQVDLTAGVPYTFRTADALEGTCGFFNLYVDTKIELLDAAGAVVATGTKLTSTEFCSQLVATPAASGVHYLRVTQENSLGLPNALPARYYLFVTSP